MRVCFLIPGFGDGGAQKQCIKLANYIGKNKLADLHIVHFHEGVHDHLLNNDGIIIHKLPARSNYDPRNIIAAIRTVERIKPDIVLSWLHACDVYGFFIKKAMPQIRWILNERDSYYPNELRYNIRKNLGKFADAIISNSEPGRSYWTENGAKGELFVTSNIIEQSKRPTGPQPRTKTVAYVGRLEPQKNVITTARAFCAVAASRPEFRFQLIGGGGLHGELDELINRSGLANVELLGFRDDAPSLIGSATALVTLSHHEGTPNVVLEAVAQGTPVVASDIPEHRAVLGPSYPFYVSDRNDPDACARVLDKLLTSETIEPALAFAQDRLRAMTPEVVTQAYLEFFEQTLSKQKR